MSDVHLNTMTVTDSDFDSAVIQSQVPVLVDFWAEWCSPCRTIAPHLEAIATEQAGKLMVGKMDVDHNLNTASRYGVQSIPTLILFKNGQETERIVGAMPKDRIMAVLKPHLA